MKNDKRTKKYNVIFKKISTWWNGKIYQNDPDSGIVYIGRVYHPSAIQARKLVKYFKEEYKFIIGTILVIIGLIFTFHQL